MTAETIAKAATESVSAVIPVYNSQETLPRLAELIAETLNARGSKFEVIFVNDGSRNPQSWQTLSQLARSRPYVRAINLMRNYGQHNALLCGIRAAQNEVIITLDDDLQHPPEEIPHLLDKLAEGWEVVYGKPQREQHGVWRNLASQFTKLAMERTIGAVNARDISSFRAFRTYLRDGFANFQSPFVSIDVLLSWATTKFSAIHVRREPRKVGKSNYNLWKLIVGTLNVITAFSTLPLRIASVLGFIMTLFGVATFVYVITTWLLKGSVPGFPFLACLIAIFSGAQLFALGIIGEYLGRMFHRSMERPVYTIKETLGAEATPLLEGSNK